MLFKHLFTFSLSCFFISNLLATSIAFAPPANDNCANAIEITDLTVCNSIHISAVDATSENNTSGCATNAADVWYKFTALSTSIIIQALELSDYNNSAISYEFYTDGCTATNRINNNCEGITCEGCRNLVSGFTIGEEYYLRIWFNSGVEADICLESNCEVEITNHTVSTCDNGDNSYDLTVTLSASNLTIGDSLVLNISGYGLADTGFKITNSVQNFTFTKTGLPATGSTVSLFVDEWEGSCSKNFVNHYTAPNPCVSPPANDNCANAIEITDLSACNTFHVSTIAATSENNASGCFSNADVWYKFTATSGRISLKGIEFSDYDDSNIRYELYSDGCTASNRINNTCYSSCEGCSYEFSGLQIGGEYYLRVWFFSGVEGDLCIKNVCDIGIVDYTVGTCDNGDNTYDLTVEITATSLEVGDSLVLFVESNGKYADNGLKITNSSETFTFNVTGLPSTGNAITFSISERNDGCYQFFTDVYTAPNSCVSPPVNDNCANAVAITDLSTCNSIHLITTGASSENNTNGCATNAGDVWYKFTATSNKILVEGIEMSDYGTGVIVFEIYSDGCSLQNRFLNNCFSIGCEGTGCGYSIEGLVISEEYYIRIWLLGGSEADFCIKDLCDFEIINVSTTDCAVDNTYDLTLEFSLNNVAVGDELALLMEGESSQSITVNSISSTYTIVKQGLASTGRPVSFILANQTQGLGECSAYFSNQYTAPASCVPAPVNDDCLDAIEITDLANCTLLHPNTFGATTELNTNGWCNPFNIDVWYKFTANVSSIELKNIDLSTYGASNMHIELFSGQCTNLVVQQENCSGLCDFNPTICEHVFENLIIGETYYFRVSSASTQEADFCVQAVNGNICNSNSLNLSNDVINQATYQTAQTITADGMVISTDSTTFIAEESITLMPGFEVAAGADFYAYIEDCTPATLLENIPSTEITKEIETINEPISAVTDMAIAPNPFYHATTIQYNLAEDSEVGLSIFNINGQLVKELIKPQMQSSGYYEYTFEPNTDAGNIYFVILVTPEAVISKKMVFTR